jgi:hypothetical protein
MRATRRTPRGLVALAVVALIGAGCADAPDEQRATGAGPGARTPSVQEKGVKFAECLRGHGVPDFPDPDASGDFAYGVSVSPAVWKQAVDACEELQPPGALSAERSPAEQDASLRFARCIRAHGVTDFPDPVNGEPLVDTTKIPSSAEPGGMDILNAAMQKCGEFVEEAAGGGP